MSDVLTKEELESYDQCDNWDDEARPLHQDGRLLNIIDRLVAEVERLRAASEQRFACVHECAAEVAVDDDGCCATCGGNTIVVFGTPEERQSQRETVADMLTCEFNDGQATADREIARLRARNEKLERVREAAVDILWHEAMEFEGRLDAKVYLTVDQLRAMRAALSACESEP